MNRFHSPYHPFIAFHMRVFRSWLDINPITRDYLVNIFKIAAIFANLVAEVDTQKVEEI